MDDPSQRRLPETIRGRFWFPRNPQLVLSGELIVSAPHYYDLNVDTPHYALDHGRHFEAMVGTSIPILYGVTHEGKEVTLGDCGITKASRVHKGPRQIAWQNLTFFANRCLVGAHVHNFEEIRFDQFSVYFTGFNQWASTYDFELFKEGEKRSGIKRDDKIATFGEIAIIEVGGGKNTFGNVSHSTEYRYWRPRFRPLEPLTTEALLDTVSNFQRLLVLLQGWTVGFDDIKAKLRSAGASNDQHPSNDENIELMVMMGGYKDPVKPPNDEMLIPLSLVGDAWPTAIETWFDWCSHRSPMLNLYFAVQSGEQLFEEHKFLFLAQALEGYHRYTYSPGWMRFKRRVKEVTESLLPLLSIFIADVPQFCQDVVSVRDEFTHPGLRSAGPAHSTVATLWKQLRTVIEICFLRDLGFSATILERVAKLHTHRY
ncbi:MAG TPA: HEPN domain-containing protein [Chthoniobacterales bacterium]|nr:HEPN domain-containing protein [Chthoniobacterales bacterium]